MSFSALRKRIFFICVFVFAALPGCAQLPGTPSIEPVSTPEERERLARSLEEKGELADALVQWKILATIEPVNDDYRRKVATTKHLIDKKSKALLADGIANLRRGAHEAAKLSFLKVLALNPKNKEAFEHLKKLSM